ncbi:hypothetical protein [Aeromonas salmonicida]|uniref:hypothetical protein n=1 Tax=Aeromonas salmonicida TaxID=645 RepID=UPI00223ECAB3|nr:hypothetical protein [Aeromonas salmonicida]
MFRKVMLAVSLIPVIASAEQWIGYTKITALYPANDGMVFLVAEPHPEVSSCDGGQRLQIPLTHPNYNTMVSTLIMAFTTSKEVYLNVSTEKLKVPTCAAPVNRFMVK